MENERRKLFDETKGWDDFSAKGGTWDEFCDFLLSDFLGVETYKQMLAE